MNGDRQVPTGAVSPRAARGYQSDVARSQGARTQSERTVERLAARLCAAAGLPDAEVRFVDDFKPIAAACFSPDPDSAGLLLIDRVVTTAPRERAMRLLAHEVGHLSRGHCPATTRQLIAGNVGATAVTFFALAAALAAASVLMLAHHAASGAAVVFSGAALLLVGGLLAMARRSRKRELDADTEAVTRHGQLFTPADAHWLRSIGRRDASLWAVLWCDHPRWVDRERHAVRVMSHAAQPPTR